jgi:sulfur carrier protein
MLVGGGTDVESREILVNGERRRCDVPNVAELLDRLGYGHERQGIAVALNGTVLPRARWTEQELRAGDRLEIVGAVQGG